MTGGLRSAAVVDLDAIAHNVGVLREHAGSAQVMAVVKADAYGHGLVPSAHAAVRGGAAWLGVAFLEEALALRAGGVDVPVLAWLHAPTEDLAPAVAAGVDLGVADLAQLARAAAAATDQPARVHLKADTGLCRSGATPADWPALCAAAVRTEGVEVVGVWSHVAFADGGPDHPVNNRQAHVFADALEVAGRAGLRPQVRHLANSAATLLDPSTHYDLVRPGVAVYGLSPVPQVADARALGLRPAMTLRSQVVLTKRVPAGSGVSYLHRHITERETTLALVPLGYGDGIPRAATNTGELWLGGRRRRIAGTVSMDQVVLDVGDDAVEVGDDVVVFGPGDDGEPTAQDWAQALDTIDYEIVTRIGARVPRVHTGGAS